MPAQLRPEDGLQLSDYRALRDSLRAVSSISPEVSLGGVRVNGYGRSAITVTVGINAQALGVVLGPLRTGHLFSELDVGRAAAVCVVSASLAKTLFLNANPVGQRMSINDISFRILGVADDVRSLEATPFPDPDFRVYIPFTSLQRRLDKLAPMSIFIRATEVELVDAIQAQISDVLQDHRGARRSEFQTGSPSGLVKSYADSSLIVSRLLAMVGIVSLLVGGIGIMNIMLATVTERTREIALRAAIGMHRRAIMAEFLVESAALCTLGGMFGILVGGMVAALITRTQGWPTAITAGSVGAALLYSAAIGLFFGYHPARVASALAPAEALRAER